MYFLDSKLTDGKVGVKVKSWSVIVFAGGNEYKFKIVTEQYEGRVHADRGSVGSNKGWTSLYINENEGYLHISKMGLTTNGGWKTIKDWYYDCVRVN